MANGTIKRKAQRLGRSWSEKDGAETSEKQFGGACSLSLERENGRGEEAEVSSAKAEFGQAPGRHSPLPTALSHMLPRALP